MKKTTLFSISVLSSLFAINALAATEISEKQVTENHYHQVGIVSVISATDSPIQLKKIVADEADQQGGKYYVITSVTGNGRLSARAIVYK